MNRLNKEEMLTFAHHLCKKLAFDLDASDMTTLDACSTLLTELPNDVFREGFKVQIGIERIIKHNLDLHPVLGQKLHDVNTEWEANPGNITEFYKIKEKEWDPKLSAKFDAQK